MLPSRFLLIFFTGKMTLHGLIVLMWQAVEMCVLYVTELELDVILPVSVWADPAS